MHQATPPPAKDPMRCVVLASAIDGVPGALLRSLRRRGLAMSVVTDPASAVAEVMSIPVAALVVVKPSEQTLMSEFVATIRNYSPRTVLWQFEDEAPGREHLSLINGRYDGHQPAPSPLTPPPDHQAVDNDSDNQLDEDLDLLNEQDAAEVVVTRDELAMLLGTPAPPSPHPSGTS